MGIGCQGIFYIAAAWLNRTDILQLLHKMQVPLPEDAEDFRFPLPFLMFLKDLGVNLIGESNQQVTQARRAPLHFSWLGPVVQASCFRLQQKQLPRHLTAWQTISQGRCCSGGSACFRQSSPTRLQLQPASSMTSSHHPDRSCSGTWGTFAEGHARRMPNHGGGDQAAGKATGGRMVSSCNALLTRQIKVRLQAKDLCGEAAQMFIACYGCRTQAWDILPV